jgi:hypothetical protein
MAPLHHGTTAPLHHGTMAPPQWITRGTPAFIDNSGHQGEYISNKPQHSPTLRLKL